MGKEIRVAIYRTSGRRDRRERPKRVPGGGKSRCKAPTDGRSLLSPKI